MFARCLSLVFVLATMAIGIADGPADNIPDKVRPVPAPGTKLPNADVEQIKDGLAKLQKMIKDIGQHEFLADVLIYEKAVRWALEYDEVYDPPLPKSGKAPPPGNNVKRVLTAGLLRANDLKDGKHPWTSQTGYVVRGYRSKIDGSVQPYGLFVPKEYDFKGDARHRLDFWWHGRGETLSEANFMAGQQSASGIISVPGQFILYPYGRYCCANKLAGDIDSLECADHVTKYYRIDGQRIVARGFSMGGAACWQYAVHYPCAFVAAAPGAGFSETPEFLKDFQKEDTNGAPWYEKKLWRMYDATDSALNLFNLPTVAYSGEVDTQRQAAVMMEKAFAKEGMKLVHIIGPGAGHSYEKGAKEEVNKKIDEIVAQGKPVDRKEIKLVVYTLRYNKCDWLTVDALAKHWERGEVQATKANGTYELTTRGVTGLTLRTNERDIVVKIDGKTILTEKGIPSEKLGTRQFIKVGDRWAQPGNIEPGLVKQHGLQGPIDDAFLDSFVLVSPSGNASPWVQAEIKHAVEHWRKQFRGDAPVKNDTDITDDDIKNSNLILWGDPSSNKILAKIADKLPVKWTGQSIVLGDKTYNGATHVPVLIYPNPLNPKKYVVLNSGFTFREYDYLNNARQTPKLPDYAVIDISTPPNARYPGKVVHAGFFGEKWELLPNDGK